MKLHCLSAYLRFIFKILLHVFKVVNGVSPLYLDDLIYKYTPHSLRSSDANLFFPSTFYKFGDSRFSICGPLQ